MKVYTLRAKMWVTFLHEHFVQGLNYVTPVQYHNLKVYQHVLPVPVHLCYAHVQLTPGFVPSSLLLNSEDHMIAGDQTCTVISLSSQLDFLTPS